MATINGPVTDEFLHAACSWRGRLFEPVEAILKGKEVRLPQGRTFRDKDARTPFVAWWYRRRTCTTPGWTRTSDPGIRNPMLYPAELRAQRFFWGPGGTL